MHFCLSSKENCLWIFFLFFPNWPGMSHSIWIFSQISFSNFFHEIVEKIGENMWWAIHELAKITFYERLYTYTHEIRTPGEEIVFTARPKIKSQSQIYRHSRSIFLSATSAQNCRLLWFMPSLGVRSPCIYLCTYLLFKPMCYLMCFSKKLTNLLLLSGVKSTSLDRGRYRMHIAPYVRPQWRKLWRNTSEWWKNDAKQRKIRCITIKTNLFPPFIWWNRANLWKKIRKKKKEKTSSLLW